MRIDRQTKTVTEIERGRERVWCIFTFTLNLDTSSYFGEFVKAAVIALIRRRRAIRIGLAPTRSLRYPYQRTQVSNSEA